MQLGVIGLGPMGGNMVRRVMRGHECVGYAPSPDRVRALEKEGMIGATALSQVSDSGEGRWTITAAIDEAVPVPVLSSALYSRFSSRGEADFADRLLSALRFQFGGHREPKTGVRRG